MPVKAKEAVLLEHSIPNPATVPVRPIRDFYSGAPPTWHDIFSNRIHRTSHYSRLVNAINSGKDVALIGMLAAGKSTLMMQVAASIQYAHQKLVCFSLTTEKAALIIKALAGQRALIFLDDFADNMKAFALLRNQSNIQVVGFERDYFYEQVSHLVSDNKIEILDCTSLTDSDIQNLFAAIPIELKRPRLIRPQTEESAQPSLYELIETNMVTPGLKERFGGVLKDIEAHDQLLHDFLIMCCYVHVCRTPASFDMAYAFLKDNIADFQGVYDVVKRLNSLLVDYTGSIVEDEQDYFIPRSSLVSQAILDNVKPDAFKRVLKRFHREVSPYRIVRFDAFRRKGYDEGFVAKAFTDWREGQEFYQMLCSRDPSPYLRP
jgi:hypothetical protein